MLWFDQVRDTGAATGLYSRSDSIMNMITYQVISVNLSNGSTSNDQDVFHLPFATLSCDGRSCIRADTRDTVPAKDVS